MNIMNQQPPYKKQLLRLCIALLFHVSIYGFAATCATKAKTNFIARPSKVYSKKKQETNQVKPSIILAQAPGLNPIVLKKSLQAYQWANKQGKISKPLLTIIDFSLPSNHKRLWLINVKTNQVLLTSYTAQGKNSGVYIATQFSNQASSHQSSLGAFETLGSYEGKHGYSMRLKGLEKGINDHAESRAIVVHPAWYMSPSFIKAHNRAGRSWGCFALPPSISHHYIDLTKDGSLLFAYASTLPQNPHT